jgi:predicted lipoprotein with Yx(FWY)xxD motif
MNNDFSVLPDAGFPAYTLTGDRSHARSHDTEHDNSCQGPCAVYWPPLLTTGRPEAGPGIDTPALGTITRPDGTHQVTYHGRPLYLFNGDAYIAGVTGTQSINGADAHTPWGVDRGFRTLSPPSHRGGE